MLHKIEDQFGQPWWVGYAAGFFDGEGSVSIVRTNRPTRLGYHETLEVRFGQTDPAPLRLLARGWGGNVYGPHARPGNQRPVWSWKITGAHAIQFLQDIYPYVTRQLPVWLALEYWAQCPRQTNRRVPCEGQQILRTGFRLALQYANRRGLEHVA